MNASASGFLVYHPVGFMAVDISAPKRMIPSKETQSSWRWMIVSEKEVIHHLKVCSFENWVGSDQRRTAQLNENTLVLSTAPRVLLGKQGIGRLTWKRVTTFK